MNKKLIFCVVAICCAILSIAVSLSRIGKPHRQYLGFIEGLRNEKVEPNAERVILSSGGKSGGARVVIIEDKCILSKFFEIFHQAPTVLVADYRGGDGAMLPDGSYFETFTMNCCAGNTTVEGRFYIGGREDVGIGFLIERSQDNDWFHGAWDPWPREAYWFKVFNHEWVDMVGSGTTVGADDKWRYEAFSFLLFLKETFGGVELRFSNGGWKYVLSGNRSDPESEALADLVELNSISEFFRRHPNLRRTLVHSERVPSSAE